MFERKLSWMIHYNEEQFKHEFPNSDLGKRFLATIPPWIDVVYHSCVDINSLSFARENHTIISATSFFYIQKVLETSPDVIADIGCGKNFFKHFIPNIHGIDPFYKEYADEVNFFDEDFSRGHQEQYDAAIAINSLHFTSIKNFRSVLTNFANIIKPGGRGYITFNVDMLLSNTSDEDLIEQENLSAFFKKEVDNTFDKILIYDDYTANTINESLDGSIRLVFEKE